VEIDYHLEVACVIGRQGRDLTAGQAGAVVFGYTLMNDWSCHAGHRSGGGQPRTERFATSLGPCIVTADEFDPRHGRLLARVNGEIWSEGRLDQALATLPELVAQISRTQTLYPGDIVGSGTFPGGCALDLGRRVPADALVELEAQGIGVLGNRVGAPPVGRAA
jgi:2-keto-4-pentenoate hydratase/2-oxohepta-3-ene-1,7-dioic acid hydratase in catechol pathway